jgi:predicted aldo/keto reductase-like oxidoreductase
MLASVTEHKQTMRYRRFGRTELEISVFSCGGMRYQQSWNDMPASQLEEDKQANLEATIQRGLDLGINHIETARGYGSSEMQLGLLLPKLPRSSFYIQTKVTPEPKDPAAFEAKLKTSLENLQLETIDFLGIHGINNQELLEATLAKGGALEVARSYQKQGRIRFIGFSTHGPLDVIVAANNTGEFDYVNLHWYFVNQFNWPAIEAAQPPRHGGLHHQPNRQGRHAAKSLTEDGRALRSPFPHAIQRPLLPEPPGGAHAERGSFLSAGF